MTNIVTRLSENISIGDSPWQFRLLAMLVILFFLGGLLLDFLASNVTLTKLSGSVDNRDLDQLLIEFSKDKHRSLTNSASLLYDFSKISLGALIASVTQGLKISTKKPTESPNDKA
jgi:Na+/proline symporter